MMWTLMGLAAPSASPMSQGLASSSRTAVLTLELVMMSEGLLTCCLSTWHTHGRSISGQETDVAHSAPSDVS